MECGRPGDGDYFLPPPLNTPPHPLGTAPHGTTARRTAREDVQPIHVALGLGPQTTHVWPASLGRDRERSGGGGRGGAHDSVQ